MKNEINKIRNAKAAGATEIAKLLKPFSKHSYTQKNLAEYSLEAIMVANVVKELSDTFHVEIASKISNEEMISDKQVFALAAKFCELDFTISQFKSANDHIFSTEVSDFEKEMNAKYDFND